MMRLASAFPSSTPHWSNELMCQIVPCVNTLCSYERDELAEHARRERRREDRVRRVVAGEGAMRDLVRRHTFGLDLLAGLAERECFRLREEVRHQQVVMCTELVRRTVEPEKVARDQASCLDG